MWPYFKGQNYLTMLYYLLFFYIEYGWNILFTAEFDIKIIKCIFWVTSQWLGHTKWVYKIIEEEDQYKP